MNKERKGKEKWMVSENTIDINFFTIFTILCKMFFSERMEKNQKS